MAEGKALDLKNCTVTLRDGATTPNTLELKIDEGNLTWESSRNIEVKRDRGIIDYFKEGDQEPMSVNIECRFHEITSSSGNPVSPFEFLTLTGGASAYISTSPLCSAHACDVVVEVDQNCGTTIADEIITFADFTYEKIGGDFKAGTLSVSGKCLAIVPTGVRTTLV